MAPEIEEAKRLAESQKMTLICYCMGVSLDGLMHLGTNHSVPVAKGKLDKYINKKAHKQEH